MAGFTSWLSWGGLKGNLTKDTTLHNNSSQADKVIHGRVTKPVSSAGGKKYDEKPINLRGGKSGDDTDMYDSEPGADETNEPAHEMSGEEAEMYFNRIRNITRGSREFPGDDETGEPADEISPEDAQMYFNRIRNIMRGSSKFPGDDETGKPADGARLGGPELQGLDLQQRGSRKFPGDDETGEPADGTHLEKPKPQGLDLQQRRLPRTDKVNDMLEMSPEDAQMYFNRIRNIMRGSREFPGDDETDEPADEISPEDAQMYFNQIRRIMRGRAEQAGEDETGEPVDEISGEDAQMYLSQVRRIVRGAADIRESSSDRSLSPTVYSSTTQETNSDYDPEEGWRYEQVFLNQILNARNEYTLMPTTWRLHFRGIPLPEGLFYVKTQALSTRPRIYAHTDRLEYRGAVALRYLIQIGARVRDLRKAQAQYTEDVFERRIVKFITSKLRAALRWAELDGDIAKYSSHLLPNVRIMEMKDLDRLDMDLHIQDEMSELAASWRKILSAVPEPERPVAPVLFGFVIYKHILFIVTLDAQNPKARCHIPCQLNLSEHNQHQWNALAIMVTICWARDLFADVAKQIPGLDVQDAVLSDPDA